MEFITVRYDYVYINICICWSRVFVLLTCIPNRTMSEILNTEVKLILKKINWQILSIWNTKFIHVNTVSSYLTSTTVSSIKWTRLTLCTEINCCLFRELYKTHSQALYEKRLNFECWLKRRMYTVNTVEVSQVQMLDTNDVNNFSDSTSNCPVRILVNDFNHSG